MRKETANPLEELYRTYRPYLFRIAYRMLGSAADAEDLVQDVFVALQSVETAAIDNVKAYLAKMVTNRCLNWLESARKQREVYVGPWLPEPLVEAEPSPHAAVEREESLSYAYLVMLERLKPLERVCLTLREALDYEYAEIAGLVGITEVYCRKLVSRARQKARLSGSDSAMGGTWTSGREKVQRFLSAFATGNTVELSALLADDAVMYTDGGGKVRSAIRPILGRLRVQVFLSALRTRGWFERPPRIVDVNGDPGLLFMDERGVKAVVSLQWEADTGRIRNIYAVMNPDKLMFVGR